MADQNIPSSGRRPSNSCSRQLFILILIVSLFFISIVPASAEDAMFRANPEHTGVYVNGSLEPGNTELWRFTTGGVVYSSPAVADGTVYIGSEDKNLYAVDARTGKEKWRFAMGGWVYSSPAVANGIVYAGTSYESLYDLKGANGSLYAIDATTGKEKWRFVTGDWMYSSLAVANGVVYVGSRDKNLYAIGANTSSPTTVPTTIQVTDAGSPTPQITSATTATVQQTTPQHAPLQYALPGAIVVAAGIVIWKRH